MFHQLGMVLATPPASVDPISNNNNDTTSKRIFTSLAGADNNNNNNNNNIQKNLEPLVICGPSGVGKCHTTVF
jgi:DNA replication protein DnaC